MSLKTIGWPELEMADGVVCKLDFQYGCVKKLSVATEVECMNIERKSHGGSAQWLNILAGVSGGVFFLTGIYWVDFFLDRLYDQKVLQPAFLVHAGTFLQYVLVLAYLGLVVFLFARRSRPQAVGYSLGAGVILVLAVVVISAFKTIIANALLVPIIGAGGGPETINKVAVMITAVTGLITAVSGFYGQVLSHRKAMAEIELERLRLELEREKLQKGNGRRNSPKGGGT
jgi:hypothetical protein